MRRRWWRWLTVVLGLVWGLTWVPVRPVAAAGIDWGQARGPRNALFVGDFSGWGTQGLVQAQLGAAGYAVTAMTSAQFAQLSPVQLAQYNYLVIPADQPQYFYNTLQQLLPEINQWVQNGGYLLFDGASMGWASGYWSQGPGGLTNAAYGAGFYQNYNYIVAPSDPLMQGVSITAIYGNYASHGWFTHVPADATVLMSVTSDGTEPTMVRFQYGKGVIFASTTTQDFWQRFSVGGASQAAWNTIFHNTLAYGIMVNADIPPTVSLTYAPSQPLVSQPITFTAHGSSPEGFALTYTWTFAGPDGQQWTVNSGATPTATETFGVPGDWTVTVTVADPYGGTASTTVQVPVTNPTATVAGPNTVVRGQVVSWTVAPTPQAGVQSVTAAIPGGLLHTVTFEPTATGWVGYWVADLPNGHYVIPITVDWTLNGHPFTQVVDAVLTVQGSATYIVPNTTGQN